MASKSKAVAESQIYDVQTTSTGAFDMPAGTTAQRPSSPTNGNIRYNTDLDTTEIYAEGAWGKVSPLTPVLTSVTGAIITTLAQNLTLAGQNFLTSNLVVTFTPAGGSASTVTVTPSSDTAATVAVPSAIYGQNAGTVIGITVTNSDNRISGTVNKTVAGFPTGGTVIVDGTERTHIFKASSTNFVVPTDVTLSNVEYLVVAGGGGGGGSYRGGGGGAGGLLTSVTGDTPSSDSGSVQSKLTLTAGTYTINVGAGGTGVQYNDGTNGGNSSIVPPAGTALVTAIGGGYGGDYGGTGGSGGSGGGGGGHTNGGPAGSGTSGQGNNGGTGFQGATQCGGGGGGAGAAGVNGGSGGTAGDGGNGVISTIISSSEATSNSVGEVVGTDVYFAGGGGAGSYGTGNNEADGGLGGGADGFYGDSPYGNGRNATHANSGGGGGGASGTTVALGTGGAGADGVVIIRYTI